MSIPPPNFSPELRFKQYKLMVETAEHNSDRRATTHRFYTTIHTSLLTLLALVIGSSLLNNALTAQTVTLPFLGFSTQARVPIVVGVSILGLILCFLWRLHLETFRRLNTAKFAVINKIEQDLPYTAFQTEWDELKKSHGHYIQLTTLERVVPVIVGVLYFAAGALIIFAALPK